MKIFNKLFYLTIFFILNTYASDYSNKNQLALSPPMGWNSFDSYGVYLYEEAALSNLEAMAEKLKPHGYEYFAVSYTHLTLPTKRIV